MRVKARWPDVVAVPSQDERDALAHEMLGRVTRWDWARVSVQRVTAAAFAAFDAVRRENQLFDPLRAFYLREIEASDQESFLAAMFRVYLESFSPRAEHSFNLAVALKSRRGSLGSHASSLLDRLPHLLSPARAIAPIATLMLEAGDPYAALKAVGFQAPHAPGVTHHAHLAFVELIGPRLDQATEQVLLFRWLKPSHAGALQTGASHAIAALLMPWRDRTPSDAIQSRLTEDIVACYGDPRVIKGGIWGAFPAQLKGILLRWLTKADMRLFCDVITATQPHHHWPPRRDYWLQLFEDRRIDEAWVAFGHDARIYAERHFPRGGFARQYDRGGSRSLLIMRIGNKIVVDGCHSYRTHIFSVNDERAPKLYESGYYCDDIMNRATLSKPHHPIPLWRTWVAQHI